MIKFENVHIRYDSGITLRDLNFEINSKEFVYLFGPSGSGKTSVLNMIYMDLFPNEGQVIVLGKESSYVKRRDIAKIRQQIGMMFQEPRLLSDRDIYSNIAIPLELFGYKSNEVRQKVNRTVDELGIRSRLSHFPIELSAGELQKVALARAMVNTPGILLVDEPTAHLDPVASDEVMKALWQIHGKGTTVLIATHEERLIKDEPARTISMHGGEIIQDRPL
jgi:cell division transport system ATP-binding protein